MKFKNIAYAMAFSSTLSLSGTTIAGQDQHSYANLEQVVTTHVHLDLDINFNKKVLEGFVEHTLSWQDQKSKQLILDTRDLEIDKIMYNVIYLRISVIFSICILY